jgi:hypothetical protein
MEIETQIERPVEPVIAPQADSGESKPSKRGGKRPGAGRKPNLAKRLLKGFSCESIAEAVSGIDCGAAIAGLLKSKREKMRLEALVYVRDTLLGRPAQNVQLSGGVLHAHTVWRPAILFSGCSMHSALLPATSLIHSRKCCSQRNHGRYLCSLHLGRQQFICGNPQSDLIQHWLCPPLFVL